MPTYDYKCQACGYKTEVRQKISDSPLTECPQCQSTAFQRGPGGGIGLHFKGSGFYKTDYASTPSAPSSPSENCCPCGKNSAACHSQNAT